mmetsp:Transcript_42680/g.76765  ORF Transcript_42680/g.76765 Transcript_42680/m.76765 type:complete len:210 (+) Transcript_42680:95-724(+)
MAEAGYVAEPVPVAAPADAAATEADDSTADSAGAKSKVAQSIQEKGEHSYYFAHKGPRDDLSKAAKIEGDGSRQLASYDGVQKLQDEEAMQERKIHWREDYAWGDEKQKVKVYLDFPAGDLDHPEMKVETKFEEFEFEVVVRRPGGRDEACGVTNGEHKLAGRIVPDKCSWRLNSTKTRLNISMFKAEPEEGPWSNLKKHVINQHTGWN